MYLKGNCDDSEKSRLKMGCGEEEQQGRINQIGFDDF